VFGICDELDFLLCGDGVFKMIAERPLADIVRDGGGRDAI